MKHKVLSNKIEKLLSKEENFFIPPVNKNVVFLMTGGIDSTLLAYLCLCEWKINVFPLYIKRGATAQEYELEAFKKTVSFLENKFGNQVNPPQIIEATIPPKEIKAMLSKERVTTRGHPLRNNVMQNIAVQYGTALTDKSVYTRYVFYASVASDTFPGSRIIDSRINTLYTRINTEEWDWIVTSPAFEGKLLRGKNFIEKIDLIKLGTTLKFPFEITRTCTSANEISCGKCGECTERQDTFAKLGMKDPLMYK